MRVQDPAKSQLILIQALFCLVISGRAPSAFGFEIAVQPHRYRRMCLFLSALKDMGQACLLSDIRAAGTQIVDFMYDHVQVQKRLSA